MGQPSTDTEQVLDLGLVEESTFSIASVGNARSVQSPLVVANMGATPNEYSNLGPLEPGVAQTKCMEGLCNALALLLPGE